MKKQLLILSAIFALLIAACRSNDKEKKPPVNEPVQEHDSMTTTASADTAKAVINRSIIWSVQGGENEKLVAPSDSTLHTFSSRELVKMINDQYPDIHLDFVKISHDTIYVKVPNSNKLANELGDTGAEDYLAATTFTLTEIKNVKFVNIAMKPGNHAEPGVYSRDDFSRLR